MSKQPSYSSVQIGNASKSLMSSQDRFRMCHNSVVGSASADTSQHDDQWELLMTQVRDQLHSANSNEFDSRAVELRQLASSEAGIRGSRNLCDPPVLVSAPGYPYYATSSFVQVSPIRPSSKEPNAGMNPTFPGQVLAEEVSSVSSSVCPRPIQRLTQHFGSGALSYTRINSGMESMCTDSSPGQILAEEILSTSSNPCYPTQLSSYRQISYAASDDRTPSQCGVFGASQATDTDLANEIGVESVLEDLSGSNSALKANNAKTEQVAPKSRSKKNFIGFTTPKELDVLAGRGGETNRHMGNVMFREKARKLRFFYRMKGTSRDEKFALSLDLVNIIQKNGGRFLGKCDGLWYVMNDDDARKKAIQALRENKWS